MTFSYYYADPDGNNVELQCDVFGDWSKSREWMQNSPSSRRTRSGSSSTPSRSPPTGPTGVEFDEIHERAMAGAYVPDTPPIDLPEAS